MSAAHPAIDLFHFVLNADWYGCLILLDWFCLLFASLWLTNFVWPFFFWMLTDMVDWFCFTSLWLTNFVWPFYGWLIFHMVDWFWCENLLPFLSPHTPPPLPFPTHTSSPSSPYTHLYTQIIWLTDFVWLLSTVSTFIASARDDRRIPKNWIISFFFIRA